QFTIHVEAPLMPQACPPRPDNAEHQTADSWLKLPPRDGIGAQRTGDIKTKKWQPPSDTLLSTRVHDLTAAIVCPEPVPAQLRRNVMDWASVSTRPDKSSHSNFPVIPGTWRGTSCSRPRLGCSVA